MPTQYVRFSGAADLRMRLVCATLSGRALRCVRAPAPDATAAAAAAQSRISGRRPRGTRHRAVARAVSARAAGGAMAIPPTQPAAETQNSPLSAQKPIVRVERGVE